MRRIPMVLATLLLTFPAYGLGRFGSTDGMRELGYRCPGCTTLSFIASDPEMSLLGIDANTAMYSASETDQDLRTSGGTCRETDYLALARLGPLSTDVARPMLLDLSGVIFGTDPERSCADASSDTWYVRADYQQRLSTFKQVSGTSFNPATVWAIVLFSEVANQNGALIGNAKVNEVAGYVKQLWPGIPVTAGYPTNALRDDRGTAFFPPSFPSGLDYIATWDYAVTNPFGAGYAATYQELRRRMRAYQKVLSVVGTFWRLPGTACPARFALNGERFDRLVRRWCSWALEAHGDESAGLMSFRWGGPDDGGAQSLINWEISNCGGASALRSALAAAARAASSGTSCWAP